MIGTVRKLTAIGIMAFAAGAVHAADAPVDWNYQFDLKWVEGSASFTPGTAYYGQPTGSTRQTQSLISWGYAGGSDGSTNKFGDPAQLRSSIVINPTDVDSLSPIASNGDPVAANAFTHYNNIIDGSFATLNHVQLQLDIVLTSADGSNVSKNWTQTFDVYFKETPNNTGNATLDADIFTITWDGDYSESFVYDGYEYTFNYFEDTGRLNPLAQSECAKVGRPSNCIGFSTNEGVKTGVEFGFHVAAAPVPEPETYAMLLAGLGIVGAVARRRRHYIAG
ncbi:MAG: THxN family PEP-CTERM protein [Azoarcus sp.]|jgi:hypothetical protein|nr:THxN family PEP-CTERM protein [Azoarcus sp.]